MYRVNIDKDYMKEFFTRIKALEEQTKATKQLRQEIADRRKVVNSAAYTLLLRQNAELKLRLQYPNLAKKLPKLF